MGDLCVAGRVLGIGNDPVRSTRQAVWQHGVQGNVDAVGAAAKVAGTRHQFFPMVGVEVAGAHSLLRAQRTKLNNIAAFPVWGENELHCRSQHLYVGSNDPG